MVTLCSLFFISTGKKTTAKECNDCDQISTAPGNADYSQMNCDCSCIGGLPVIVTSDNADTVKRNNKIDVWIDSGGEACPKYTWEIIGNGFHFGSVSGPNTAITNADSAILQIWADNNACGSAIITVRDCCGETSTISVREPDNGKWVLIEDIECGTLDNMPGAGTCHSDFYCIEGGFRYLDSWVAGTNMNTRWHSDGNCSKYSCTPYDQNYCYAPGYYPKFYHVGIHYKKKWRWDCQ